MKNKTKLFLVALVFLAAFVGWKFIFAPKGTAQLSKIAITKSDLEISTSISGKVKSSREVSLSFPLSGRLTQIASESAFVSEGEVVAMLDAFDLYSAYQAALSNLNKARSTYSNAVEAKAELDATYAGRESDNIVKAKLAEGKTNVEAAYSAVDAARFSADQSLALLSKAVIRAPFSGTIVKSSFKVGEVPPMTAEVARLADLSSFYFEAEADEVDVGDLKTFQEAKVKLDAFPVREFAGGVTSIDAASHTTASGGTAYGIRISLPSAPGVVLRSGFNGEAKIIREVRKSVLTIPANFVSQKDGKNFVDLFQNTIAVEKEIQVGEFVDGRYELLGGLAEGDVIVQRSPK